MLKNVRVFQFVVVSTVLLFFSLMGSSLLGSSLLGSSVAFAGSPQTHDGFLLRLSAGPGYATTEFDNGSVRYKYSGGGADLNIAIGAMVSDSLALHATLGGWNVFEPDAEFELGGATFSGQADDISLGLNLIGVGVTTYFSQNFYFSGSLGFAIMSVDDGSERGESEEGIGADLTLGKEWWVSEGWGLGIAGALGLHSVPVENAEESFQGGSLGVRFSATYN